MGSKLERAGTLPSAREEGRVLYDAVAVEELRREREVRKAERVQAEQMHGATALQGDPRQWTVEDARAEEDQTGAPLV